MALGRRFLATKVSETSGALLVSWGAEHKAGDFLISRQVSIRTPASLTCYKPHCLWRYLRMSLLYILLLIYHEYRTKYAEANRHKTILEYYRTGEPSPETIWQAIIEIAKLKLRR